MGCPDIFGLTLNEKSIKAINHIRNMREMGSRLPLFLAGGTFVNIFAGNGMLQSSYNIVSTDWDYLAQALRGAPGFVRRRIRTQAEAMVIEFELNYDHKQREFWKAIADGCEV